MANIIQIKRSLTTVIPTTLAEGELAYSEAATTKLLYIGTNAGASIEAIGGKSIVDKVNTIAPNSTSNSTDIFLLNRPNHTGTQTASTISDFTTAVQSDTLVAGAIQASQKGAINGVATLDGAGLIPILQLPSIAISNTYVVMNQAAMLALTAQIGDVAVRTDLSKSFILTISGPTILTNWQELLTPTSTSGFVTSVNGVSGVVVLTSTSIAEGTNLYYTDGRVTANATVAANTAARHTHSNAIVLNNTTSSYTTAINLKMTGIAAGATANASDAALLSRANHTGTQLASTISDFTAASILVISAATLNGGTF